MGRGPSWKEVGKEGERGFKRGKRCDCPRKTIEIRAKREKEEQEIRSEGLRICGRRRRVKVKIGVRMEWERKREWQEERMRRWSRGPARQGAP